MNRLNSEVSISTPEVPESAYPLYVENRIYLPFARHLATEDEEVEEEESGKAA
jgi:hypothetical protein